MHLPDLSGPEPHQHLKADARFAHMPIVIFLRRRREKLPEGAVAYVRKASDPDTLLDVIQRACLKE